MEVEPGDDLLQQGHHEAGRDRPGEPAAGDARGVPRRPAGRSSRAAPPRRRSGRPRRASSSSPGSTSTRCTPPSPVASSWSRTARRPSTPTQGKAVADFWATMYSEGLSPQEKYSADSFADGKAAMAIVGPWAIAVYGDSVNWGAVPVPTSAGTAPGGDLHVLRRQEHRPLLGLREPEDRVRGAEVRDQRGAGREAAGADRPDAAAHGPGRRRTPTTSRSTRSTRSSPTRPAAPSRCPTCRTRSRSGRPSATSGRPSVIFGKTSVDDALTHGGRRGNRARRPVLRPACRRMTTRRRDAGRDEATAGQALPDWRPCWAASRWASPSPRRTPCSWPRSSPTPWGWRSG